MAATESLIRENVRHRLPQRITAAREVKAMPALQAGDAVCVRLFAGSGNNGIRRDIVDDDDA